MGINFSDFLLLSLFPDRKLRRFAFETFMWFLKSCRRKLLHVLLMNFFVLNENSSMNSFVYFGFIRAVSQSISSRTLQWRLSHGFLAIFNKYWVEIKAVLFIFNIFPIKPFQLFKLFEHFMHHALWMFVKANCLFFSFKEILSKITFSCPLIAWTNFIQRLT